MDLGEDVKSNTPSAPYRTKIGPFRFQLQQIYAMLFSVAWLCFVAALYFFAHPTLPHHTEYLLFPECGLLDPHHWRDQVVENSALA